LFHNAWCQVDAYFLLDFTAVHDEEMNSCASSRRLGCVTQSVYLVFEQTTSRDPSRTWPGGINVQVFLSHLYDNF